MTGLLKREYKEVAVGKLLKGMEIFDDVINKFGNVLIPANTEVVDLDKIKNILQQHNIMFVKVKVVEEAVEETEIIDFSEIEESGDFSKVEKHLNEIRREEEIASFRQEFIVNQKSIRKDFDVILKGNGVTKDQIKNNIDKTLQSFKGSINVFQLLEKMKDLDDVTYAHSQNVMVISHSIGKWLGLKEDVLQSLVICAMLIDIGKMKIPSNILNKAQKINNDELLECQKHAIYSHDMIKKYDFISEDIKQAVLLHHERMDGTGYPMGLKGDKIPLMAKIIAIADVYNALTSHRPYRSKKSPFEAIKILETEYVNKLDSKILYVFLNRIGNCFIGQNVKLNDERIAEIVYVAKQNIYRPVVKLEETGDLLDLCSPKNSSIQIVDFV